MTAVLDFVCVAMTYDATLDRAADQAGAEWWQRNAADIPAMVHGIALSPEAKERGTFWSSNPEHLPLLVGWITEECSPEPAPAPAPLHPAGWVDAGNGVFIPPIGLPIRFCESSDNYLARNSRSSSSGGWQFTEGTARFVAGLAGRTDLIGRGDNVAGSWSPADQDRMFVELYNYLGGNVGSTMGWAASQHCWGGR